MIPTIVKEKRKTSAKKPKPPENGFIEDGKMDSGEGQGDDEYNYEEDFEDYEEDFEDEEADEGGEDGHEASSSSRHRSDDSEEEKNFEEVTKRELINRSETPEVNIQERSFCVEFLILFDVKTGTGRK